MISDRLCSFSFVSICMIILSFGSGCVTTTTAPDGTKAEIVKSSPAVSHRKGPGSSGIKEFERGKFDPALKADVLPLSKAYSVYKSSQYKPSGVHIHSGLVFVIVNVDTSSGNMRRKAKGLAMLRSQAMLRKYFSLPRKFSFINRQLEGSQYYSRQFFRYCIAYSLKDIQDYKREHKLP